MFKDIIKIKLKNIVNNGCADIVAKASFMVFNFLDNNKADSFQLLNIPFLYVFLLDDFLHGFSFLVNVL